MRNEQLAHSYNGQKFAKSYFFRSISSHSSAFVHVLLRPIHFLINPVQISREAVFKIPTRHMQVFMHLTIFTISSILQSFLSCFLSRENVKNFIWKPTWLKPFLSFRQIVQHIQISTAIYALRLVAMFPFLLFLYSGGRPLAILGTYLIGRRY